MYNMYQTSNLFRISEVNSVSPEVYISFDTYRQNSTTTKYRVKM